MFLMGLNENFPHVKGQILLMDPSSPITKVFSLVIQEEKQKEVGSMRRTGLDTTVAFMNKKVDNPRFDSGRQQNRRERSCALIVA